jgi:cytochrome P450
MTVTDAGADSDELDPFEQFNRAMGQGLVTNPYPDFAAMRAEHLYAGGPRGTDGRPLDDGPPGLVTAASYDAVFEVLRDGRRFSSAGYAEIMGQVMGRTILQMDEPEHHTYRKLLQQAFSRRNMERWEPEIVRPIVDRAIDDLVAAADADAGACGGGGPRRAELVRQLTFPFPVDVVAAMFDLPREHQRRFHRLAVQLISVTVDMDLALQASQELAGLLTPLIEARRDAPGDDLISILTQSEVDGQRLTNDEILAFCRLLLPAGAETTYRSSSNLLVGLLTHPEQLAAVREDRSLIPQAIEEGLRWEPPLLTIFRTTTVDTQVCGVDLPAGTIVLVNMGAANHDDTRWDEPERFDIFRPPQPHVAFASGPHLCLGMHLARMETRVVLDRILDRLPDIRLDPDADAPVITGMTFRSPSALPVTFT